MRKQIVRHALMGSALVFMVACSNNDADVERESTPHLSAERDFQAPVDQLHLVNSKRNSYVAINNAFLQLWAEERAEDQKIMELNEASQLWNRSAQERFGEGAFEPRPLYDFSEVAVAQGDFTRIRSINGFEQLHQELSQTLNRFSQAEVARVDQHAYALNRALEEGLPVWRELQEYIQLDHYADDGGEKGRQLLPKYIEAREAISNYWLAFSNAVEESSIEQKADFIEKLEGSDDQLLTHTTLAMERGGELVQLFPHVEAFKSEELRDKSLRLAEQLKLHLDRLEVALNDPANKMRIEHEAINYHGVFTALTALLESYESAFVEPQVRRLEQMIGYYNSAVSYYNGVLPIL